MDKVLYADCLYTEIKDHIECDTDVYAITKILLYILKKDPVNSITKWLYLIKKYDIDNLKKDIDFSPLVNDYPLKLLETIDLTEFFNYLHDIPARNIRPIYNSVFNIYDDESYLYKKLSLYIENHNLKLEERIINEFLSQNSSFYIIFDKTTFIKKIITIHIKYKYFPKSFLQELISQAENKKDEAVLKGLILDYLII